MRDMGVSPRRAATADVTRRKRTPAGRCSAPCSPRFSWTTPSVITSVDEKSSNLARLAALAGATLNDDHAEATFQVHGKTAIAGALSGDQASGLQLLGSGAGCEPQQRADRRSPPVAQRRTGTHRRDALNRRADDEPFLSAAGAAIVEFELGPGTDHITDVGNLGRLHHTGRRELDALADV